MWPLLKSLILDQAMGVRFLRMLCLGGGVFLLNMSMQPGAPEWIRWLAIALPGVGGFLKAGDKNMSAQAFAEMSRVADVKNYGEKIQQEWVTSPDAQGR